MNLECLAFQSKGNNGIEVTREAVFAVGTEKLKRNGICIFAFVTAFPKTSAEVCPTGMKDVVIFIGFTGKYFAVNLKCGIFYSVGKSAYGHAVATLVFYVAFQGVSAKHNIYIALFSA